MWNLTLAWRHARWRDNRESTGFTQANAFLTVLKQDPDYRYLAEVSSVPLQQVLRIQQTALVNFFVKRARYPRFKARAGRQAAEYTRSAFRWRNGELRLAKMDAPLQLVWSWPDIDPTTIDPSTVTVSRDPDGRWYVSLLVEIAKPEQLPATGSAVGVDLGLTVFAMCSDGTRLANPRHMARKARNLARYQRRLARKQPDCGILHDRDMNAAKNILAAGLAVTACGADVRHTRPPGMQSAAKQEPHPARAGKPRF